jgi:hypothetical protein
MKKCAIYARVSTSGERFSRGIPASGSSMPSLHRQPVRHLPLKIAAGRYRRRSPHSGHTATIQLSGAVPTGAETISARPLHRMAKSQSRDCGRFHTGPV